MRRQAISLCFYLFCGDELSISRVKLRNRQRQTHQVRQTRHPGAELTTDVSGQRSNYLHTTPRHKPMGQIPLQQTHPTVESD